MDSAMEPGRGAECPTPHDLISSIAYSCSNLAKFSTFTTTIYDSAWLSMIYKRDLEQRRDQQSMLFPVCFDFILKEQRSDGGWQCYGSHFDGILNSLAALLALVTHRRLRGVQFGTVHLGHRIESAESSIQDLLRKWDLTVTVQVGFEVLVTGLLTQLRSSGFEFRFPASPGLKSLYERKMQHFVPDLIYSGKQTTFLHSLEALVGVINFDRVRHHCSEETGIMASPAATAAYLIHSTVWDLRAEKYLRMVLEAYSASGGGGVPSAFPTPIFEITWTLSSMLSSGTRLEELDSDTVSNIVSFLTEAMQRKNGTIGFAPGILPDADDTARSLITLQLLGQPTSFASMVQQFEAHDHFRTYELESHPSFSANCNVLLALQNLDVVDQYEEQVSKTLTFVLQRFENDDMRDKWNLRPQYCAMLLTQAFVKILQLHQAGKLQLLNEEMIRERIPVAICQNLLRTLQSQGEDGGWNKSLEETSYSVLTITQCLCLPWNRLATARLEDSLKKGRDYVRRRYPLEVDRCYFWVEKTTFESALLKVAYCSMAIYTERSDQKHWETEIFSISEGHNKKMAHLLSMLPNFTTSHLALVDLVLVEASHLSKFLRRIRQDTVSRDQIPMSKDRYLDFIPVIWAMCNSKGDHTLPAKVVRDMVWLSLLNYQIDEFMETVVEQLGSGQIRMLIGALRKELGCDHDGVGTYPNGDERENDNEEPQQALKRRRFHNAKSMVPENTSTAGENSPAPSIENVLIVLRRYLTHIRTHEAVLASPPHIQRALANELYAFLLGHIMHNADNIALRQSALGVHGQGFKCADVARSSQFKWVHTTGADDTSCPFSFQFFACLISHSLVIKDGEKAKVGSGKYCFEGAQAGYVAQALARRLAVMCRMYNDYGSAARDKAEGTLNSLDFAEFHHGYAPEGKGGGASADENGQEGPESYGLHGDSHANGTKRRVWDMKTAKEELMDIAEFERKSMELAMQRLEEIVQEDVLRMVRVFVDVTDTFGLLYVCKDIASSRIQ